VSSPPTGQALVGCLRIRLPGALFNACSANAQLVGRKNRKIDPVEGVIIPLGGAATFLIASIPFSPCRRLKITICSGGPGGSTPWRCPRRCGVASRSARSVWPVGDRAHPGGTDGDGVSGRQAGPRDR